MIPALVAMTTAAMIDAFVEREREQEPRQKKRSRHRLSGGRSHML